MLSVFILFLGLFGCGGSENDFELEPTFSDDDSEGSNNQHRLVIDLQDGFYSDTVRIEINGLLIDDKDDVTTALLTGLAASIETEVAAGEVSLAVIVPTRDISSSIELEITADTFIGVSLAYGALQFIVSDTPFGYG
jgi:hypothetical protein